MAKRIGVTPDDVRLAVIRASGNLRQAARALGCSDSTIRYHLKTAPPVKARVTVAIPPDTDPAVQTAILEGVRGLLDQMKVDRLT